MFVAASTECFPELSLTDVISRLVDLEFTAFELAIHEKGNHLKPSQVESDFDEAVRLCSESKRLTPVAFSVDIEGEGDQYYNQFSACAKLAKAMKVISITVPAAELGTPFNAEIERLRELVRIAAVEGVLVSVRTEIGCITQDPDTAVVLCDNVKGLGITLDPSHYIAGPHGSDNFEQLMKHVYHTHLRDTSKDKLQVRVGQGKVEYGRLVTQLTKVGYQRALCVHLWPDPESGIDHMAEMRKIRLLLESLV